MMIHTTFVLCLTVSQTCRCASGLAPIVIRQSIWKKASFAYQLKVMKDDDDDLTDPQNWYADTNPEKLLIAVKRANVTKLQIQKSLEDNAVATLADLFNGSLLGLVDKTYLTTVLWNLPAATRRLRKTVEEILGGSAVFENKCLPEECFNMFALGAVSVVPSATRLREAGVRKTAFTFVLGSRGSGKTMFALKQLPNLLFADNDISESKAHLSIHFRASIPLERMQNSTETFEDAVVAAVHEQIAAKLHSEKLMTVEVVDLHLHVIIDDAGEEVYRDFFDQKFKIQLLVDAIENRLRFKFLKGVHVTIVGAGLEYTAPAYFTSVEPIQFRMQPWTLENFKALAEMSEHPAPQLVVESITDYPILEHLITNARCAYYVLMAMPNKSNLRKTRMNDFVKGIVRSAADNYIVSSGLAHLTTPQEKFEVVRSVFRELDKSTGRPGEAFFPTFDDIAIKTRRSIPYSLVDVNVESSFGMLEFVSSDINFSLSLSPALVIVLANLVNSDYQIPWDWEAFDSIVMLNEMKRIIVETEHIPSRLDPLILHLQSPFPESSARERFSVPMVGNSTVILNGRNAGYADVIAPYRLVQCKFSDDDSITKDLFLQTELDDMGLTSSSSSSMFKQFVTDVFYTKMWSGVVGAPPSLVDTKVTSTKRTYRHECYPFDILNSRRIVEERAVIVGEFLKDGGFCLIESEVRQIWSGPVTFDNELPVTAVFATNCNAFRLKQSSTAMATEVVIGPDDVDWHGKLLDPSKIPADFIKCLRDNVEIRFIFFGRH